MDAAITIAPEERQPDASPGERRCLATGAVLAKAALLRFVVGPDHVLVPDLAQNLPGRGLWVTAEPEAIELAARKNLFAKSARTNVKIPPDLTAAIAAMLRKRCLDLLGLSKRAGIAVLGQPQVESALRAGKLGLLLLADDVKHAFDSRVALPIVRLLSRDELGAALGYEQIVYLGLMPHSLTDKIHAETVRLEKMTVKPHID